MPGGVRRDLARRRATARSIKIGVESPIYPSQLRGEVCAVSLVCAALVAALLLLTLAAPLARNAAVAATTPPAAAVPACRSRRRSRSSSPPTKARGSRSISRPTADTIVFELLGDIYTIPDRRRQGDAHHERPGVRRAAALLARRQVDRVRQRSLAVGQPLDHERRRHRVRARSPARTIRSSSRRRSRPTASTSSRRRATISTCTTRTAATGGLAPHRRHRGRRTRRRAGRRRTWRRGAERLPRTRGRARTAATSTSPMRNSTGGGYNQTSLGWQIGVLDRETGRIFTKTNAVGSGMRPELSPDGKWLAYATRNNAETSLMLRDLDDRRRAHAARRRFSATIRSRGRTATSCRRTRSRRTASRSSSRITATSGAPTSPTGKETMIPFTADVDMMIAGPQQGDVSRSTIRRSPCTRFATSRRRRTTSGSRSSRSTGSGRWICRTARRSVSRRRRTSASSSRRGRPTGSTSPTSRGTTSTAAPCRACARDGSGQPEKLSGKPAYYEKPAYSLDGRRIVVGRGPRNMRKDLRGARASARSRRSASSSCGCRRAAARKRSSRRSRTSAGRTS